MHAGSKNRDTLSLRTPLEHWRTVVMAEMNQGERERGPGEAGEGRPGGGSGGEEGHGEEVPAHCHVVS